MSLRLVDELRCLQTVHNRHLDIHENQLVSPVWAPTFLVKSLQVLFYSYFSITGFLDVQLEVFLNHHLDWCDVEVDVVNYQNSRLASAMVL